MRFLNLAEFRGFGATVIARIGVATLVAVCTVAGLIPSNDQIHAVVCNTYETGCQNDGAVVPCSNTTYCYSAPMGLTCTDGAVITNYKNSAPDMSWSTCDDNTGKIPVTGKCKNSPAKCGTVIYYAGPCGLGGRVCTLAVGLTPVQFCKIDGLGTLCAPAGG